MQCRARKKYNLVLLWHDCLIAAGAVGMVATLRRVVQAQLSSLELGRFAMEEIDEGQPPGGDSLLGIITMSPEEIAIIAGGDLHFGARYRKLVHSKLLQNSWKRQPNSIQNQVFARSGIHEYSRTPMIVVRDAGIAAGRNHFTHGELVFVLQRVAEKFLHLLGRQKFIQYNTFCSSDLRGIQNCCARS